MKKGLFLISTIALLFSCSKDDNESVKAKKVFDGTVTSKEITVSGELTDNEVWSDRALISYKGSTPNICYYGNTDNSVEIAWHDRSSNKIKITSVDNKGNKTRELTLNDIPLAGKLLGFTKIPFDNSFAIAFSANTGYPNEPDNLNIEYHIARFDQSGNKIFTKGIWGGEKEKNHRNWNPAPASSARLAYNPTDKLLTYFLSCNRKMGNGSRHQGSTHGMLSIDGKNHYTNTWWGVSHDYQQRILIDKGEYLYFGHGDHGPRGLYMSRWYIDTIKKGDKKGETSSFSFWPSGKKYRNYNKVGSWGEKNMTNVKLGSVIQLNDGNFASIYTQGKKEFTRGDMGYRDVYYHKFDINANTIVRKKITNLDKVKESAGFARIGKLGDNVVIGWHNTNKEKNYAFIGEYDTNGNTITDPKMVDKVLLQSQYDFINLPNGDIFWASNNNTDKNKLILNWIKAK